MQTLRGLRQADIPKLKQWIAKGKTASEIAVGGLLGYCFPERIAQSFIDPAPEAKPQPEPKHPQDRAAADKKEALAEKRKASAAKGLETRRRNAEAKKAA